MTSRKFFFETVPAGLLLEGGIDFNLPRIVPVAQEFDRTRVADLAGTVTRSLEQACVPGEKWAGARIAVAVGSRGIASLDQVIGAVVSWLKEKGARPFIVPAMGSHGGPTAEGQAGVLAGYGITEARLGVPVLSSLEVVLLGHTDDGLPVWFDATAHSADGVLILNRVKPHTDFSGEIESGLMKMLAVGLGKHRGASLIHSLGFPVLGRTIVKVAREILRKAPVIGGVALLENAYKEIAAIEFIPRNEIETREKALLLKARKLMPALPVQDIDLLLVQQMGKDVSGAGFDPNVTGRRKIWGVSDFHQPQIAVLAVLDLTGETHGNAAGIGIADLVSLRALEKIDIHSTYASLIACTLPQHAHIPMVFATDRETVAAGAKISRFADPSGVRLCWIQDTSHLDRLWVSEPLVPDLPLADGAKILGSPVELPFSVQGRLDWLPPPPATTTA